MDNHHEVGILVEREIDQSGRGSGSSSNGSISSEEEESLIILKPEAVENNNCRFVENTTLSVIIRSHRPERLPFLEEAIFSLSIQEWTDLEIVVVIQNGTEDFVRDIDEVILHQPWQKKPKVKIYAVEFAPGADGRSTLLNYGITHSVGRYLAFLDDDDLVYQHAYTTLIPTLMKDKRAAVAVGGCRVARTSQKPHHWYITAKDTPFTAGRSRYDLFRDNFIPIHSYVIDREVVSASDLYFDDEMPPLEDYDFLLRLSSKYDFDFSNLDVFVCEYRIHNANSIPYTSDATQDQIDKHKRAFQLIEDRKKTLQCFIPFEDLLKQRRQEMQVEENNVPLIENPKVMQKALLSLGDKAYDFFKRYPRLEKKLSDTVHRLWNNYKQKRPPSAE